MPLPRRAPTDCRSTSVCKCTPPRRARNSITGSAARDRLVTHQPHQSCTGGFMPTIARLARLVLTSTTCFGAAVHAQSQEHAAPALDEIVVTAQRRGEEN